MHAQSGDVFMEGQIKKSFIKKHLKMESQKRNPKDVGPSGKNELQGIQNYKRFKLI